MILTHLVMFSFFDGAGDGTAPAAPTYTVSWLSPSPRMFSILFAFFLWALHGRR